MENKITEIRNVSIPDFFNMTIAQNMSVGIKDGLIDWVCPPGEKENKATSLEKTILDGSGKYLVPGMVNLHAHTAMVLLRGLAEDCTAIDWFNKYIWIYEQGLTSSDVYLGSLLGGAEMLLNGVTAVADHYFSMEQSWKAFNELGIRADLSWAVFGLGDDVDKNMGMAEDFISEYKNKSSRISISLGPHSPYLCPDSFLKKIANIAQKDKLKIHIHASEDERQNVISIKERNKTPIEILRDIGILQSESINELPTIIAHGYYATTTDLDILLNSNCYTVHCPKTYLRFGDSYNFLCPALDKGINLALGTDGAASNYTMNILEQARLSALMAKSSSRNPEKATARQILPLMFSGGRALGFPNYGIVQKGNPADLLLLDMNTPEMIMGTNVFSDILYALDQRNVDTVIVDGKVLVSKGRLLNFDYSVLKEEAKKSTKRLLSTKADSPMQKY